MNSLITQPITLPERFSITGDSEDARNSLIQDALAITAVTNAESNTVARNVTVELRQFAKSAEALRVELNKPILSATRLLKAIVDDHLKPVYGEIERLERLATVFAVAEQARAAAEDKARLDLAAEAKTEADFHAVMAEPTVERAVAQGQQLRRVMKITITDIVALAKTRPELVRMEPNLSAINALCVPGMPNLPPGLLLSYENKSVFTTR